MTTYNMYIAGEFKEGEEVLEVSNPHTGEVFAKTFKASEKDFEDATIAAQKTLFEMANMSAKERYDILRHISDKLDQDSERLGKILAMEAGKPFAYAHGEIKRAVQTFLTAAEEAKRMPGEELMRLDWTDAGAGRMGVVRQAPIGLVAGIAPFNFPLNLAAHKIAPAIAAGCPIVLKPASATPLSCLELAKIIDETTLPKGAVSIMPMDRETGNKLVTDPRYNLLSFTGSPVVGWKMKEQAGKKKVVLELGGNAAVIIAESANMGEALPRCMIGGFAYQGQVCIHTQRYIVHSSHYDEFLETMKKGTELLGSGNPEDKDTEFSSMIDEKNAIRVKEWVDEAVSAGAILVTGGGQQGAFMEPTILTNVPKDTKVVQEEVFGPVIIIESYDNFNDAIKDVNDTQFGLQAGIYTNDTSELGRAFRELHVGGVIHNDVPTFRVDHMPYGGVKESGLGREGVKYAIADMLEPKILVTKDL